jgi:hypothetical protein
LNLACVATCPAPYSGYNNGTARLCVPRCPTNYYYADNTTNQCVTSCVNSFASDDVQVCVPSCSIYSTYKLSDNSTNTCVNLCPSDPDSYA